MYFNTVQHGDNYNESNESNLFSVFVPFREVLESLTKEQRERWNRLWFIKTFKRIRGYTDTPGHVIHPLVYPHPITGEQVGVVWTNGYCFIITLLLRKFI